MSNRRALAHTKKVIKICNNTFQRIINQATIEPSNTHPGRPNAKLVAVQSQVVQYKVTREEMFKAYVNLNYICNRGYP